MLGLELLHRLRVCRNGLWLGTFERKDLGANVAVEK